MKHQYILFIIIFSFIAQAQICYDSQEIPPSNPSVNFVENNDGTVSDTTTGLMWSKCYIGHSGSQCEMGGTGSSGNPTQMDWQAALIASESSSLAGHDDWRLPNIKELATIIERACAGPAANSTIFPRVPTSQSKTWSSSKSNVFNEQSFIINFHYGSMSSDSRTTLNYVRLVRNI